MRDIFFFGCLTHEVNLIWFMPQQNSWDDILGFFSREIVPSLPVIPPEVRCLIGIFWGPVIPSRSREIIVENIMGQHSGQMIIFFTY